MVMAEGDGYYQQWVKYRKHFIIIKVLTFQRTAIIHQLYLPKKSKFEVANNIYCDVEIANYNRNLKQDFKPIQYSSLD
jgi:hypothetical protein